MIDGTRHTTNNTRSLESESGLFSRHPMRNNRSGRYVFNEPTARPAAFIHPSPSFEN